MKNLATLYIFATMSDSNPNNKPINIYMNTLVFSIIALVFAAVMLTLLVGKSKYAEFVRPYSAFIITVQVGLILIVIWALYRVWVYEKKLNDMYEGAFSKNRILRVSTCPDYWTLSEDGKGKRECTRNYDIGDGAYITMPGKVNKVDVTKYDLKMAKDVCPIYKNEVGSPWSSLKSECESYPP